MNIEQGPSNEAIKLTSAEFEKFANTNPEDPELLKWMQEKGIVFGDKTIDVEIDGEKKKMYTGKEDFGTLVVPEKKDMN